MITAEVYSRDPLTRKEKHLVGDGLDIIGQYAGGISVVNSYVVQFCPDMLTSGYPDPDKFDYCQLDPATHLHLFASPFRFADSPINKMQHGVASYGSGLAWVDNTINRNTIPSVAAHEIGHSLGYLLPGSPRDVGESQGHCKTSRCIMYPNQPSASLNVNVAYFLRNKLPVSLHELFFYDTTQIKYDFCNPCADDIRSTIDEHVDRLERNRSAHGVREEDYVKQLV